MTIAQNEIKLREFDAPPALRPYKWIKGEPVTEFKKGNVYVVEFGATCVQTLCCINTYPVRNIIKI